MVDCIFVNRLTEVEDVLAVLLVEVREIALVPLALSGCFFLVLLLLIKQVEERGSVYRGLGLLVERERLRFGREKSWLQDSVDVVDLRYPLLKELLHSVRGMSQVSRRDVQDMLVGLQVNSCIQLMLKSTNFFRLLQLCRTAIEGGAELLVEMRIWLFVGLQSLLR